MPKHSRGVSFQLAQIKNQISTIQPFSSMCLVGSAASQAWQQILSDVLELRSRLLTIPVLLAVSAAL